LTVESARSSFIVLLRRLKLAKVVVEAIEARLPVAPVFADPVGYVAEPLRLEAARPPLGLASLLDEPGALEDPQVLRDRRETEVKRGGQLRDCGLPPGESSEDAPASGIGQSRERDAERIGLRCYFSYWLINLLG